MKKRSLPEPRFIDSRGTFKVILYHQSADAAAQNPVQSIKPPKGIQDDKGLIDFCRTPRSRAEIIEYLEIASGQYALRRYLDPLIESGAILLTLPDTPRSPKQKYVTAEK